MIEINVRKDGITVSGHSGYAPIGQDIVCAGVSTLVQTMLKSIEDLTDDRIEYDISSGRADIEYKDLSESGKLLVDSFFIGVCMIAREYPECIRVV